MINQNLDNQQGNVRYFDSSNLDKTEECQLASSDSVFKRSDIPVGIDMGKDPGVSTDCPSVKGQWRQTSSGHFRITECEDGKFYIRVTE